MEKRLLRKNYISEIDRFLQDFDKAHPQYCAEREREIAKHARIFELRDEKVVQKKD